MCQASSDGGAAAADTYMRDTVLDVSATAPCASSRPMTSPSAQPGTRETQRFAEEQREHRGA